MAKNALDGDDGAGEHRTTPGDPLRISGACVAMSRHHEGLEPPVAGNEKGAEERGQVAGEAGPSQRLGLRGCRGQ